jgi:hypothetical protein
MGQGHAPRTDLRFQSSVAAQDPPSFCSHEINLFVLQLDVADITYTPDNYLRLLNLTLMSRSGGITPDPANASSNLGPLSDLVPSIFT